MNPQIISIQIKADRVESVKSGTLTKRLGRMSRAVPGYVIRFKFESGDLDVKLVAALHVALDESSAIVYNPATGETVRLAGSQLDNMAASVGFVSFDGLKAEFPPPFIGSILSWRDKFAYQSGQINFES